jgi:glyoxylase-like metal-dependent hydrolase (beta-lactamase superfamily II)
VNLAETFQKEFDCKVFMSKIEIDYYSFNCNNLNPFESSGLHSIGSIPVMVYLTPGHTAGSACYVIGKNIFTGDTLFVEGCGLCWGKGANPEQMFCSLNMLKEVIPHNFFVHPSHSYGEKPGATFEYVKSNNIYLNIICKEKFIAFRMRENQKGLFEFK